MTIEIKPETEQLVREELSSGRFQNVDDLIAQGVRALREKTRNGESAPARPRKNLAQFLLESPLPGSNLRIERQKDYPLPAEL